MSNFGYSVSSPYSDRPFSPKKGIGMTSGFSISSQHQPESPLPGGGAMSVSPDHHQGHLSSSGSSPFLPNYLLGGPASPTTTPKFGRSLSNMGHSTNQSPHPQNFHRFTNLQGSSDQMELQQKISPLIQHNIRDRSSNGPPVEGLYDNERNSIDEIYAPNSWNSTTPLRTMSMSTAQRSMNTPGSTIHDNDTPMKNSSMFRSRHDVVAQSPAQMDPFYTQGEGLTTSDILDETWVTVFGFPPSLVGFVLEEFSHYGLIVRKETMNNVNWLHIQYQTKLQAKKALSKNGKILNGNMMIGVSQCIDKEVMMGRKLENGFNKSVIGTPSLGDTQTTTPKQSTIRPLTAAYHAAANQNKIVQEGKSTPQKNNSVISRAMEYVFGL